MATAPEPNPAAPAGAAVTIFVRHRDYSRDHAYHYATNQAIRRRADQHPGEVMRTVVIHEDDGSCCQRERWSRSLAGMIRAAGGDGLRTLGITGGPEAAQDGPLVPTA